MRRGEISRNAHGTGWTHKRNYSILSSDPSASDDNYAAINDWSGILVTSMRELRETTTRRKRLAGYLMDPTGGSGRRSGRYKLWVALAASCHPGTVWLGLWVSYWWERWCREKDDPTSISRSLGKVVGWWTQSKHAHLQTTGLDFNIWRLPIYCSPGVVWMPDKRRGIVDTLGEASAILSAGAIWSDPFCSRVNFARGRSCNMTAHPGIVGAMKKEHTVRTQGG